MKTGHGLISSLLWVIFVNLIAPDISFVRSLLASIIGGAAIWLLATEVSRSTNTRSEEKERIQGE
jgi:hypothetical protein